MEMILSFFTGTKKRSM